MIIQCSAGALRKPDREVRRTNREGNSCRVERRSIPRHRTRDGSQQQGNPYGKEGWHIHGVPERRRMRQPSEWTDSPINTWTRVEKRLARPVVSAWCDRVQSEGVYRPEGRLWQSPIPSHRFARSCAADMKSPVRWAVNLVRHEAIVVEREVEISINMQWSIPSSHLSRTMGCARQWEHENTAEADAVLENQNRDHQRNDHVVTRPRQSSYSHTISYDAGNCDQLLD